MSHADVEALSPESRRLLEIVFSSWVDHRVWPTWAYIGAVARQEAKIDPQEAYRGLPRGLVRPEVGWRGTSSPLDNDQVALTLEGLATLPEAQEDIAVFIRALAWLGDQAESYRPPVIGDSSFAVDGNQIATGIGRDPSDAVLDRVFEYLQYDAHSLWSTFGGPEPGQPRTMGVRPVTARHYAGVATLEDVLRVRDLIMYPDGRPSTVASEALSPSPEVEPDRGSTRSRVALVGRIRQVPRAVGQVADFCIAVGVIIGAVAGLRRFF